MLFRSRDGKPQCGKGSRHLLQPTPCGRIGRHGWRCHSLAHHKRCNTQALRLLLDLRGIARREGCRHAVKACLELPQGLLLHRGWIARRHEDLASNVKGLSAGCD